MRRINIGIGVTAVLLVTLLLGCDGLKKSEERKKYDSLFLGFSLGMDRKEFFDLCWEMNRKKIFTHGPTNENVEYQLHDDLLKEPVTMRFYPSFVNDKIFEMPVTFTYKSWAPWNKEYWADTLLVQMLPVFEKWYNGKFEVIVDSKMGNVYYKMDGKRRINLFKKDDQFVQAVFTDLKVLKEKNEKADSVKVENVN